MNPNNLGLSSPSIATAYFILLTYLCFYLCSTSVTRVQGFDSLLELPRSGLARLRPRSKRVLSLAQFGAIGDGLHDDSQAFRNAWRAACSFPQRIRIIIPAGYTLLLHPIDLAGPCKSRVTLNISGTVIAPNDPAVWKGLNPRKWIYFHGVKHLTIEGEGKIDGRGQQWWAQSCKINKTMPCYHAPTAVTFHKCKDLKVKNINIINSQKMHIAFTSCIRVSASHLVISAPASSPNTDGIHISASRVVNVKDSIVQTGDDCVSIVSNSSRITIKNFTCGPGHGISIGSLGKSNSTALVHDVVVDGALLSNSDNGVRIKTWQGGSGNVTEIKFQNVLMENVSNPIIIDQYYCDSSHPCANQTSAVNVKNISFVSIRGTSATKEAIRLACSDASPCEGIYLEDIQLMPYIGEVAKSFCWQARGSSQGVVYPPPCFSCRESFIQQQASSDFLQPL